MKHILKIFVMSFLFLQCDVNMDYEGKTPGVLYLPVSGVQKLNSYDVGELFEQEIWVGKGGLSGGESTLEMVVASNLLDSINHSLGTSYQLLPENCFEISPKTMSISGIASEKKFTLRYDPSKILESSNNAYDTETFILPLKLNSTQGYEVNPSKSMIFYTFKVSDPVLKILNPEIVDIREISNETLLTALVGVPFTNKWNITANITHSQEVVNEYNSTSESFYELLPANAYEGTNEITLQKGENKKELSYKLNASRLRAGNYIFPVQINSITSMLNGNVVNNIKFDAESKRLFIISKKGIKIPKNQWTIVSKTTEEAVGEGSNNGRAIHLIDDDTNTFWHSKWQGGSTPLPYEIVIDMGETRLVSQLEIVPRNIDNNSIKYLRFETSSDNHNWEYIGKFAFDRKAPSMLYPVKATNCRYIKLMIPEDAAGSRVTAIRELTAYGE